MYLNNSNICPGAAHSWYAATSRIGLCLRISPSAPRSAASSNPSTSNLISPILPDSFQKSSRTTHSTSIVPSSTILDPPPKYPAPSMCNVANLSPTALLWQIKTPLSLLRVTLSQRAANVEGFGSKQCMASNPYVCSITAVSPTHAPQSRAIVPRACSSTLSGI